MKRIFLASVISILIYSCAGDSYSFFRKTPISSMESHNDNSTPSVISRKQLLVRDYIDWVENKENGLRVEKKIDELTFSALYKPYEYIAVSELKKEALSRKELDNEINGMNGLQYFTFRIASENKTDELIKMGIKSREEYGARIEYFSFKMQNDMKLIDGKDTLDCLLFHFERVYGMAPYATFVLGFPLTEKSLPAQPGGQYFNNKTLVYDDKIFNVGKISLTINKEDLNNLPNLITD